MDKFYYSKGKRISLRPLNSAYVVEMAEDRANTAVPGWRKVPLRTKGLVAFVKQDVFTERDESLTPAQLVQALHMRGQVEPDQEELSSLRSSLKQNVSAEVLPALINDSGHVVFPTGEVTLQLKPGISPEQLTAIAQEKRFRVLRPIPYITNGFVVKALIGEDGVDLSRVLVESGVAVFAEPNFVEHLPNRLVISPSNSDFPKQWHLSNTGQLGTPPGVDIAAIKAWEITTGSASSCIAIIDNGVDLDHEAFTAPGKVVAPFDFEDSDNLPMPIDSHGTCCAGIAVAPLNRGKVLGVAPECALMPIRRAAVSDHLKMADAFAWAADKGADVISCSFGYDNRAWPQPEIVSRAVEYAATRGRNGKGCVIVWAAGNGNESISTDEWASNNNVIAVAAVTDKNERASYSDYGKEVDVCAPSDGGVNGITTTSIGGYTNIFGGTSAAAPMVAGVAGLILSISPNLSAQEVRNLICVSADKVDMTPEHYDASTGHSIWYGYGRVNAHNALHTIDVLREAVRGDYKLETSVTQLTTFRDEVLLGSAAGKDINDFLRQYKFRFLNLLIHSTEVRSQIQQCLRWVIGSGSSSNVSSVPPEILNLCRHVVKQVVAATHSEEGEKRQRQVQSIRSILNKEGMAMSENRAAEHYLDKIKDILAEATTSTTAIQDTPPATVEQSPTQTRMANGANVEVGHLVSTVMEAVNRSSPELLKGRGGITIGMWTPPVATDRNEIRPDDPYIPKTPIDKLADSPRIGSAELDAFASKAGAIMSDMLTQRSAMTLPGTRRAESLAKLRRLNLITEAESTQLEKLATLFEENQPLPADYSLLLREGRSGPVFKAIVSCALAAEKATVSSSVGVRILEGGENRWASGGRPPSREIPERPDPMSFLDDIPKFDVGQAISTGADAGGLVALWTGNSGAAAAAAIAGFITGGFGFGGTGGQLAKDFKTGGAGKSAK